MRVLMGHSTNMPGDCLSALWNSSSVSLRAPGDAETGVLSREECRLFFLLGEGCSRENAAKWPAA